MAANCSYLLNVSHLIRFVGFHNFRSKCENFVATSYFPEDPLATHDAAIFFECVADDEWEKDDADENCEDDA